MISLRVRRGELHWRWLYRVLAWCCLLLGVLGVVLPLLPTTPFLLCCLWFSVRAEPRLAQWLLQHPRLGPPIARWQRERSISPGIKRLVLALLLANWAILWLIGSERWVLLATAGVFSGVLFLVLRIPCRPPQIPAARALEPARRAHDQV